MERLTVKEPTMGYYYSGYSTTDLINRLAHYEDLEEQGLLVKKVRGKWEYLWFDSICSVCGYTNKADSITRIRNDHNFCPNCGADMREEAKLQEMAGEP